VNRIEIAADEGQTRIHRNIYGHFAEHLGRCIYEGIWVGEDSAIPNIRGIRADVVAALRRIKVPVLRWPGGCFADEYHWRDGIGPRAERPTMVNTHWGGVSENNHFGTHEFMDLCDLLGAAPYICGNVGSGTVQEMQQWVEYITFPGQSPMADLRRRNGRDEPWALPYFGVGNENWGCGGSMRPEYYADLYRRYQTYVRHFGAERVFRIACGANSADCAWTEVLMREAARHMDGLSLHYYTVPGPAWEQKGSATDFDEAGWITALRKGLGMDELIRRHGAIMDRYDPERRVALIVDEWGAWHDVEPGTNPGFLYQQNTLRDALLAALTLNIFNEHCARVRMANLAQMVNVLQAVLLTEGAALVTTPTYHVFALYAAHQDALLLPTRVECDAYAHGGQQMPQLSASASGDEQGNIHLTLCNVHPRQEARVSCVVRGRRPASATATVLTAARMNAYNSVGDPAAVRPAPFGDPAIREETIELTMPAMSVVALRISRAP
jgi:alpha-N-arabinofuranosidase